MDDGRGPPSHKRPSLTKTLRSNQGLFERVDVDVTIADDKDGLDGRRLLADLRLSHSQGIRLLAFGAGSPSMGAENAAAGVYQFIGRPLESRAAGELGFSCVGLANKIRRYDLDGAP